MMPALVIESRLPELTLAGSLPLLELAARLPAVAILTPLPILTIPVFPVNLDDGFIDENGVFLVDENGNNLIW